MRAADSAAAANPAAQLLLLGGDSAPRADPLRCCGLDEVGRGALAGPLVAAAVVLPQDCSERLAALGARARFLRDSKTVPAPRRVELAEWVHAHALTVAVVEMPVTLIDAHGIGWANREAFRRLIMQVEADEYIVDGKVRPHALGERGQRVRCLVRADAQVLAVAAASLVAKVHRDALMANLQTQHHSYGWETNAGYGTAAHIAALRTHGASAEHRALFVATALADAAATR